MNGILLFAQKKSKATKPCFSTGAEGEDYVNEPTPWCGWQTSVCGAMKLHSSPSKQNVKKTC
ncbi:MAG TPA: hypothetical protein DCO89_01585 [Clostridiales bacterium]|nr:hypothetical protein [Clostridiales bacterium]